MAKKITLREIAALTGTSVSTVSKALNQSPEISENTRRRIIEVARVSHYRAGQQLDIYRDGHQQMIGFWFRMFQIRILRDCGRAWRILPELITTP